MSLTDLGERSHSASITRSLAVERQWVGIEVGHRRQDVLTVAHEYEHTHHELAY